MNIYTYQKSIEGAKRGRKGEKFVTRIRFEHDNSSGPIDSHLSFHPPIAFLVDYFPTDQSSFIGVTLWYVSKRVLNTSIRILKYLWK